MKIETLKDLEIAARTEQKDVVFKRYPNSIIIVRLV